ncbi:amino acid adenylation domain-containing protein [Sphaerisporangium aureirubrum]|uniref:Amino acid adenylation domain-containing protein n=1 Tax=Sphaerisporangium aureirubrum TaxID=1544736 RepID=A0ABW1NEM8_9ACTN
MSLAGREAACLHEVFERLAAREPGAVAVDSAEGNLTYGELDSAATAVALTLRDAGAGPETTVGVSFPVGPGMVTAILGVLKAGAAYVPLDPGLPEERRGLILGDTGASVVLDDTAILTATESARSGAVAAGGPAQAGAVAGGSGAGCDPDNAAYVMYTSGSTGRPKGVVVTHRGVLNRVMDSVRRHAIVPGDRVLLRTPIGFDGSVWEMFVPLLAGATVVIGSGDMTKDARAVVRAVVERGVTVMQAVPSMLAVMSEEAVPPGSRPRLVYAGGERFDSGVAARVARSLGAGELWNAYGPTECTIGCVEGRYVPGQDGPVPIGEPIGGTTAVVLGRDGGPVTDGEPGELYIGGEGVARGYLGAPALTADRFVPGPDGTRLYRTGDLVRRPPGGALEFLGRVDQQLKVRGVRIEPGEVEEALVRHPGVPAAAVAERGNLLVGYVVGDVPAAELRAFLRDRLPSEYVPTHFVSLSTLPRTPNGKLDRAALPAVEHHAGSDTPPPRDAAEELVRQVWAELLPGVQAGPGDDFFQLGGYSLLVPKLAARLNRRWGAAIPVADLYAASTVRAQAELLSGQGNAGSAIPRAARSGALPLSSGQRRLWFLDRLEPGSPEYIVPLVVPLPPAAEPALVRDALHALAARHEILRTTYRTRDGEPRQVVAGKPVVELAVSRDDLAHVLRAETGYGFDLAAGPVWRATLCDDGRLVLIVHHIACDGLSTVILRRDLLELCAALAEGREPHLPDLPLQYADFAGWQERRLGDDVLRGELDYWRTRLDGITPLDLPADRPRPQRRSPAGAVHTFEIGSSVAEPVLELGRRQGATAFMVFMAAYCCLLARLCGTRDVVLGTPVAGRLRPELDDLVGFFVNSLVLRCDLSGAERFEDAVERARQAALGAFAHQELPFEQLIEAVRPERDLSVSPLFQVMFELVDEDPGADDALRDVLSSWNVAKFDLTLHLERRADGSLLGVLEYATDLFDRATAERLAGAYLRVLEGVAAGASLADLEIMSPGERHQVVAGWNDTARDIPDACVHELIEQQARRTPGAVAVEDGRVRLTYAELDARANGLARRLRDLGVGPDVPVGVLLERSADLVIGLLGVLKAGGCYVPLETTFPPARIAQVLSGAGARLCLADPGTGVPDGVVPVPVAADGCAGFPSGTTPDDLVAVYYTSGSTGRPKGVAATHRGWVNRLVAMQDTMRLRPGDAVLQKTTVVFDDTPVECFWPLMVGARVVLMAPGAHRDPVAILRAVAEHDVTVVLFVPSMLSLVLESLTPARRAGLRALRHVGTSGEALSPELARQFLERFGPGGPVLHNHWGVTEASIDSTRHEVTAADAALPGPVRIGRPLANNRIHVLDEELRPVPPGVRGEIYVGGPVLARGYYRDPGRTAQSFVPDPFGHSGRLYRTGDRACLRPDGTIAFLGRTDHQIKIRGIRVELGEIEETLRECPGVRDAAVIVWESPSGGKRIAGYTALGDEAAADGLEGYLRDRLPGYMIPSVLTCLPEIPRTASGKLDRGALPRPDLAALVEGEGLVPPRNATEQILLDIWTKALEAPVGIHNSFFRAGGHSLLAAQVIVQIQETFDLELPLRTLFEQPTIAQLATVIEEIIRAEIDGLADEEVQAATTWKQGART